MSNANLTRLADYCAMIGLILILVAISFAIYTWKIDTRFWWMIPLTLSIGAPMKIWGYNHSGARERNDKLRGQHL